jgi:NTE family protein
LGLTTSLKGQGVGVVLSGGGGAAMAHIGVLKALEENNIPIDYITGSSMGALIGALYAAGYSPIEIEAMVLSETFKEMAQGEIDAQFSYYLKQQQIDPSYLRLRFKPNQPLLKSLPTHVYNSQQLDFHLMTMFASAEAVSSYNYDSLMLPFRCVASDIYNKESVIFSKGHVGQAVRASMTYPFYLQPISIDSVLYFDGGLYDNFPKKVMKDEFHPDFIIGSNVSSNAQKPEEDDLFSQLENMLSVPSDYKIDKDEGIMLDIKLDVGALDLSEISRSIYAGYSTTMANMDSIKNRVERRMSEEDFDTRRRNFNSRKKPLHFESLKIEGLDKQQEKFIKASFDRVKDPEDLETIKLLYFKLYSDDKIKFIFPTANYDPVSEKYQLNLSIRKEKNIEFQIGGVLSTSPINTGYASFKYNFFNKTALSIGLNGYFGNVYQSVRLNLVLDVPAKIPFFWEPYFCINNYDYFENRVSVFDETQPPFIITNGIYVGNSLGFPFVLNSIFTIDYKYFQEDYTYYTNDQFSVTDTSDNTIFSANTVGITIDRFNFDYKQYPSSGTRFYFNTRFVTGWENTNYLSPQGVRIKNNARRTWLQITLDYNVFPIHSKFYSLGFEFEGYFSNMPNFSNYSATIIEAKAFEPLTESITLFQPHLRSTSWLAVGLQNVFKPFKDFQIRVEGYLYQPAWDFYPSSTGQADRGILFDARYFILSAALVYHTKLGPISLNGNYYQNNFPETSLLLNFGYTLFNKSARD